MAEQIKELFKAASNSSETVEEKFKSDHKTKVSEKEEELKKVIDNIGIIQVDIFIVYKYFVQNLILK